MLLLLLLLLPRREADAPRVDLKALLEDLEAKWVRAGEAGCGPDVIDGARSLHRLCLADKRLRGILAVCQASELVACLSYVHTRTLLPLLLLLPFLSPRF